MTVGDNVDCYDSTKFWYASTILQKKNRHYQGSDIDMVYIAYRVNHPDGDSVDTEGNKYFGWEPEYDDWVPLQSARLSKYQSMSDPSFKH